MDIFYIQVISYFDIKLILMLSIEGRKFFFLLFRNLLVLLHSSRQLCLAGLELRFWNDISWDGNMVYLVFSHYIKLIGEPSKNLSSRPNLNNNFPAHTKSQRTHLIHTHFTENRLRLFEYNSLGKHILIFNLNFYFVIASFFDSAKVCLNWIYLI